MKNESKLVEVKDVVQDVAGASLETGLSTVLEYLPELGIEAADIIGNEAVGATIQTLTGGVLGAVAPALLGFKLSYQQRRFERNMVKMVNSIKQNQVIITQRMDLLETETRQKFICGPYRDVLLDNIISENEVQKVQDNINGYINLMGLEKPNDDVVFSFFQTLSQMNEVDIRILKLYRPFFDMGGEEHEDLMNVLQEENLDEYQYRFIREKLCRLGMLDSKNEILRRNNLDVLGDTLSELIKQLYSKNPKQVKSPKLKRISISESYQITMLGRQYLALMDEPK